MSSVHRIVVAGAGLAGLRSAEQLRGRGFTGELLIIGGERHPPYNRPPLSKEALRGPVDHDRVALRSRLGSGEVQWRLAERVQAADLPDRVLSTDRNERIEFDTLVAATGVRARTLPLELPGPRHLVRTLDDAAALSRDLVCRPGLLVVGSGFIGCEVAATARQLGCEVDVVDIADVPLGRPLGSLVGAEVQRRHEAEGVRFHLGRHIVGASGVPGNRTEFTLDDGTILTAAVVVEAVGSIPNVEWLTGNGLDLTDGVRTDSFLRPVGAHGPFDNVCVVGDLARFPNALFDAIPRRIEHWNIPAETARRASQVLLTRSGDLAQLPEFAPVPSFWSDQHHFRLQSFGMPSLGTYSIEVLEGTLEGEFAVGYFDGAGRIVGVVLVGLMNRHSYYRNLIVATAPQICS